ENNEDGKNQLRLLVHDHYKLIEGVVYRQFREEIDSDGWFHLEFLLNRNHVARYSIGPDDKGYGTFTGGVSIAIGPYYFGPHSFWSYENGERFSMNTTPEAIEANLKLLDEFLGLRPTQDSR